MNEITILRIKRRRQEDPVDALLIGQSGIDKRLKVTADSRVYRLLDSVESTEFEASKFLHSEQSTAKLALHQKQSPKTVKSKNLAESRRDVLAASKLAQAKAARYKIVMRNRESVVDGQHLNIVDISKEEDELDEITSKLMPMVREYLNISECKSDSQEDTEVYDLYYHDASQRVSLALEAKRVATLALAHDERLEVLLDGDDVTDSDYDSEDSNAEDYYANDYPDEEDEEYDDYLQYQHLSDSQSDT